jgi:hypothetical protein
LLTKHIQHPERTHEFEERGVVTRYEPICLDCCAYRSPVELFGEETVPTVDLEDGCVSTAVTPGANTSEFRWRHRSTLDLKERSQL